MLQDRMTQIHREIELACQRVGRHPSEVTVVAISKKKNSELLRKAFTLGQKHFGENYLQEAIPKREALSDLAICWHYTGRLQRKKVKAVVGVFEYIHSIDSLELAFEVERWCEQKNLKQKILLQVNLGEELSKGGVTIDSAKPLLEKLQTMKYLQLEGLMSMPPITDIAEDSRKYFSQLRQLKECWQKEIPQLKLKHLSMGTSTDYVVAIEEGATMVRIGTALLGERDYSCGESLDSLV